MTSAFEQATAIQLVDGAYAGSVPDLWQQGKGAFGGVVLGLLARAIIASEADATRTLRSLSGNICAPVLPGPVEATVSSLRRGGSMSFIDARLNQGGSLVANASAVLSSARAVKPVAMRPPSPARTRWQDAAVLPVAPPLGPVFAPHYEYRSTGPLPFTGGQEPVTEGWLREAGVTPSVLDEAAIVGMLDAWWPTLFSVSSEPRAVATVAYTMQLLVDPRTLDPAEPLFYRARGVAAGDNFIVEMRELWSGDDVVGLNQQTFAILS